MKNKLDFEFPVQILFIVVLTAILFYNLGGGSTGSSVGIGVVSASNVIPSGIPSVYGEELGITYDDISPTNPSQADTTIRLLGNIDRTETIEGAELERYINILYTMHDGISCEYCCGARSIIFADGKSACGCAHSYAMRGLTKYLVMNHGDEFTDEEMLEEIGKWKVLFFPGIHEGKADVLKSNGIELNYINLASNKYRGIEKGQTSGGGMVGGC